MVAALYRIARFTFLTSATWAVGLVFLVFSSSEDSVFNAGAGLGLLVLGPLSALLYDRFAARSSARKKETIALEEAQLRQLVRTHRAALLRNLERAVKRNDYGAVQSDETAEAKLEFLQSVGLPVHLKLRKAALVLEDEIATAQSLMSGTGFDSSSVPLDGLEFENWVAQGLTSIGWDAAPTRGSGDQGIDVIAEKHGVKVGLQCKLYSSSVGNKAVQEALAGKHYYDLDRVAVLTNSRYTQSARDLAVSSGVILMTHHDLLNADGMLLG